MDADGDDGSGRYAPTSPSGTEHQPRSPEGGGRTSRRRRRDLCTATGETSLCLYERRPRSRTRHQSRSRSRSRVCMCGVTPQTTAHLICCSAGPVTCTREELMTAADNAVKVAQFCANDVQPPTGTALVPVSNQLLQMDMVAEKRLDLYTSSDYIRHMIKLSEVLAQSGSSQEARAAAGLYLKNRLTSDDRSLKDQYQERWRHLPKDTRLFIKKNILAAIGTEHNRPSYAAQCVAYVAAAEFEGQLKLAEWNDLVPILVDNLVNAQSSELKMEATLSAIGHIYQEIGKYYDVVELIERSEAIHTAVIHGMKSASDRVRLAATNALKATLGSLSGNKVIFETDSKRNEVMEAVIDATRSNDIEICVAALKCLGEILSSYYDYMEPYMEIVFSITLEAMKSDVDEKSVQGMAFWFAVCYEEIGRKYEEAEAGPSKFYAKQYLQFIVPVLIQKLPKKDDNDEDLESNPPTAAFLGLTLLSQCCSDEILSYVSPFINSNMKNENWQYREAAIMAFSSILDGVNENTLKPLVEKTMPPLIEALSDSNVAVRAAAARNIDRIFQFVPQPAINGTYLKPLLKSLINGLDDKPRVAARVCSTLTTLAEAAYEAADCGNSDQPKTYCISNYYDLIIKRLLETSDRQDAGQQNLRSDAYKALMGMVKYSPTDCHVTVQNTIQDILKRLLDAQEVNHISSQADRSHFSDNQTFDILQSVLCKVTSENVPQISDRVMKFLLTLLADKADCIRNEVFNTVTILVKLLGEGFLKYMNDFVRYLYSGLKNDLDIEVCMGTLILFVDICKALGSKVLPYCDDMIGLILENLVHPSINRLGQVKILSTFGDIALSIGPDFGRYFDVVIEKLLQVSNVLVDSDDDEMREHREGILHAYTGIVQGLLASADGREMEATVALLEPHLEAIVRFMVVVASEPERPDEHTAMIASLMGDLYKECWHSVRVLLGKRPLQDLLMDALNSPNRHTRTFASRAIVERNVVKPTVVFPD